MQKKNVLSYRLIVTKKFKFGTRCISKSFLCKKLPKYSESYVNNQSWKKISLFLPIIIYNKSFVLVSMIHCRLKIEIENRRCLNFNEFAPGLAYSCLIEVFDSHERVVKKFIEFQVILNAWQFGFRFSPSGVNYLYPETLIYYPCDDLISGEFCCKRTWLSLHAQSIFHSRGSLYPI